MTSVRSESDNNFHLDEILRDRVTAYLSRRIVALGALPTYLSPYAPTSFS